MRPSTCQPHTESPIVFLYLTQVPCTRHKQSTRFLQGSQKSIQLPIWQLDTSTAGPGCEARTCLVLQVQNSLKAFFHRHLHHKTSRILSLSAFSCHWPEFCAEHLEALESSFPTCFVPSASQQIRQHLRKKSQVPSLKPMHPRTEIQATPGLQKPRPNS